MDVSETKITKNKTMKTNNKHRKRRGWPSDQHTLNIMFTACGLVLKITKGCLRTLRTKLPPM